MTAKLNSAGICAGRYLSKKESRGLLDFAVAELQLVTGRTQVGPDSSLPKTPFLSPEKIAQLLQHYGGVLGN